ncbi:MAG: patatin-like phospholipase family protein [Pseudomonadota bacterium]
MATLGDWLDEKPYTLTLSSGFFAFYAHLGVLSVLEREGLMPARLTGSSAGALVAAGWVSGLDCRDLKSVFFSIEKRDFWDPGLGFGFLRGERFRQLLAERFGCDELEAGRRPIAISTWDWRHRQTLSFDQGPLPLLVSASCAVPGLFQPVHYQRHSLLDGGVMDRHGLHAVAADERVFYHHIVSRSPWRRRHDPALIIPERANLAALAIHDLVRSGPNRMAEGALAFEQAFAATERALERPLPMGDNGTIDIGVEAPSGGMYERQTEAGQ